MVLTYLTNIFNNILKTKQIPDSWHEAKIVILFKKGDPKDIENYRPISLLSHSYKILQGSCKLELKELWTKTNQVSKQVSEKAILQQTMCKP